MPADRLIIPGIVVGGVIVPRNDAPLPEGARVDILIGPAEITPQLKAELDGWECAADEAWAMIDEWEQAEQ